MTALVNRIIRKKTNPPVGLLKDNNGNFLGSKGSLNQLLNVHFPGNLKKDENPHFPHEVVDISSDDASTFITKDKVKRAIQSFGNFKAPGPDGLKPIVLKHLGDKALDWLTNIFHASILLKYQPKAWRKARVVFIPKEGKPDYNTARSFRPITLSSFVMKVLERVVLWHLEETVFSVSPLHINQHAFRRNRSCESALTNMVIIRSWEFEA